MTNDEMKNPQYNQCNVGYDLEENCVVVYIPYDVECVSASTVMPVKRLVCAAPDLLKAAKKILVDLNDRIKCAKGNSVPVFDGIAELAAAIHKAGDQDGQT